MLNGELICCSCPTRVERFLDVKLFGIVAGWMRLCPKRRGSSTQTFWKRYVASCSNKPDIDLVRSIKSITLRMTSTHMGARGTTTSMLSARCKVRELSIRFTTSPHVHAGKFLPTRRTPGISTSDLLARLVSGYRHRVFDKKLAKMGMHQLMAEGSDWDESASASRAESRNISRAASRPESPSLIAEPPNKTAEQAQSEQPADDNVAKENSEDTGANQVSSIDIVPCEFFCC